MNTRTAFVAVGLMVNLLFVARSAILMLALGYADLGLVALVQSVIVFSGLLHFGLLNGGYRLLCHAGPRTRQRIIDFAYSGFAIIAIVIALSAGIVAVALDTEGARLIVGLAALGGFATLLRSWMMNEMVAAGRFFAANIINSVSILASLAMLAPLLLGWDVTAKGQDAAAVTAVLAIIVQPVLFALLALVSGAVMRPRKWHASRRLGRIVFGAGFILFLTGIAIQFITLIERAYVSSALGLEPLGRLYLAILFLTLFQMVPNLVQPVFLPALVQHWKAKDFAAQRREWLKLVALMVGYCVVGGLALWLLAEPLLAMVLPQYVDDLRWVYLLAPGLFAFALASPFAILFNVLIDYRWMIIAYGAGVAISVAVLGGALVTGTALSLDGVILLRSGVYGLMAILLVAGWWQMSRRAPGFRLLASG